MNIYLVESISYGWWDGDQCVSGGRTEHTKDHIVTASSGKMAREALESLYKHSDVKIKKQVKLLGKA